MNFDESEKIKDKVEVVVNRTGFEAGQISSKSQRDSESRDLLQIPTIFAQWWTAVTTAFRL